MTALIAELSEIAEPFIYIPAARRIMAACESRDWQAITAAANEAASDPKFMKAPMRADALMAWAKRANRLTLKARAA